MSSVLGANISTTMLPTSHFATVFNENLSIAGFYKPACVTLNSIS